MRLSLQCIPCFIRHSLEMAQMVSSDTAIHEQVLREALNEAASWDMGVPAPLMSQRIHRRLRELTGVSDPYKETKLRHNQLALGLLPELRAKVESADDPLSAAVRVAIAGNVIDVAVNSNLSEADIRASLERSLEAPFAGDMDKFRAAVFEAEEILYLADNTGEIVFDRLLIEQLPPGRVTVAVRGAAVLNDATLEDARAAGLHEAAELVDNGSGVPGTVLPECSASFRNRFERANLIIAKGQGNFETLAGQTGNIFFLLKIKCPVVASHTSHEMGTHALIINRNHWASSNVTGSPHRETPHDRTT
jgi:uncharacterized protein with ATP-grasp and redox domains